MLKMQSPFLFLPALAICSLVAAEEQSSTFLIKCTTYFAHHAVTPVPTSLLSLTITETLPPTTTTVTPMHTSAVSISGTNTAASSTLATNTDHIKERNLKMPEDYEVDLGPAFPLRRTDTNIYLREAAGTSKPQMSDFPRTLDALSLSRFRNG